MGAGHCRELEIPVPPQGYWAKVQAGQTPRKRKLPELSLPLKERLSLSGPGKKRRARC